MPVSDPFMRDFWRELKKHRVDRAPLIWVLEQSLVAPDGLWLEFGVGTGRTLRMIADTALAHEVFGFDSFEGLPEDWVGHFTRGFFSTNGVPPEVPANCRLIKGWFEDTLPAFCEARLMAGAKLRLLHVDCDLYSSTKTVFEHLGPFIDQETVVVFDELCNYPGFEDHEMRALREHLDASQKSYEVLAWCRGVLGIDKVAQEVALRIV